MWFFSSLPNGLVYNRQWKMIIQKLSVSDQSVLGPTVVATLTRMSVTKTPFSMYSCRTRLQWWTYSLGTFLCLYNAAKVLVTKC